MPVPPLIPTEPVGPNDHVVGQSLDLSGASLNPTDQNLKSAGIAVAAIAALGILLAFRNPKYALGIMTGTLGASMLGAYIALSTPTPQLAQGSSSSAGA
jgi:hypothetical protein